MSTFELKGVAELIKAFEALPEAIGKRLVREGLQESAELIQDAIRNEAPEGPTGTLKDSIVVTPMQTKKGRVGLRVTSNEGSAPGQAKYHSSFVEYGTSKQEANPFMRRGFESTAERATDLAIQNIKDLLEQEGAK